MGENSAISWTDHTFNPWIGCTRVSPGCEHCYAETLAGSRLRNLMEPLAGPEGKVWGPTGPRRAASETTWRAPHRWHKAAQKAGQPAFVFCASLADVYEDVSGHRDQAVVDSARVRLWATIAETPHMVWLLLTKRPENVARMVPPEWMAGGWPANAWIGCTVEDQRRAEERLPHLLDVPAPVRFVSYEPALGPVDWNPWFWGMWSYALNRPRAGVIDWLIVGGESGPKARPFRAQWARDTIRQCREARVPVWMKQAGADPRDDARGEADDSSWPGGIKMLPHPQGGGILRGFGPVLRDRAGADPAEWPVDLRVQERPAGRAP